MRISWNWLRTLIDPGEMTPGEVADALTSTGLEVESVQAIEPVKGMLRGVVVGHVLECDRHPGADRLTLCMVDIGQEAPVRIVCGAPNVAVGQKVLVATVGSTLHMNDGSSLTIKKAKIRGEESNGMICAEDELGLGGSHAGIVVLDTAAAVGTPAAEHLGLHDDHVFEIGLTPNRADAMSHWGVARDLAAALSHRTGRDRAVTLPDVGAFAQDDQALTIPVEVFDTKACPRYAGLVLTQVSVGASPAWLQERLKSIGLKPVNNVVDVTNYVQHELGQPLHAFDAGQLRGGRIEVKQLPEGTPFITLDGKERKLSAEDLMICDAGGGACIAGVFGGLRSGVTDATTSIFLESACFDARSIRRTARRHGLNTDASFRFERGVDPEITVFALKRAAILLKEVAGARISSSVVDHHPDPVAWKQVRLHVGTVDRLSGMHLEPATIVRILQLLDHRVSEITDESMLVQVPPYRVDVRREADLVEEVLRIHGFDRVPMPERLQCPPVLREEVSIEGFQEGLTRHFSARGFREVMTPSLVSGAGVAQHHAASDGALLRLRNPLSAELDVLRPTMIFGLLAAAAHNLARQQRDLRLFERGRTYAIEKGLVRETDWTGLLITGRRWRERWRSNDVPVEAADLKAEVEALLARMNVPGLAFETVPHPLLHAAVEAEHQGVVFAVFGQVKPEVAAAFGVSPPAFCAELLDAAWIEALRTRTTRYTEVSRFPAVRRDLSLLLDEGIEFAQLEKLAHQAEHRLLRNVDLFDVYQGDKLPKGKKSYALSFILQDEDRTLTDDVVEKAMSKIRQAFEKEVGAELRG